MDRRREPAPTPSRLASMLGGWTSTHGTLAPAGNGLRRLMELGEIAPDTRLPSERTLAAALVVSRSTVVGAYELLHGQGVVDSRRGSGHWTVPDLARPGRATASLSAFPWVQRLAPADSALAYSATTIDLSVIAMTASPVLHEVLAALGSGGWAAVIDELAHLLLGKEPLRQAIADQLAARGQPTTAVQVVRHHAAPN